MSDAREWTDRTGRTRWQPVTSGGEALWWTRGLYHDDLEWLSSDIRGHPRLFRRRRAAVRAARTRELVVAKSSWTPATEVDR